MREKQSFLAYYKSHYDTSLDLVIQNEGMRCMRIQPKKKMKKVAKIITKQGVNLDKCKTKIMKKKK